MGLDDVLWREGCRQGRGSPSGMRSKQPLTRCWCTGYLRRAAHASPGYLELCLHTLTMGVAVLSLFTWLADLQ